MVYDKEHYQKNKIKINKQQCKWNKKHREQINLTRKKWRHGKGKEKNKISKKKSDAKHYTKFKNEPIHHQKRIDYMIEYNNRPKRKITQKKVIAIHRAKPEVKKKNAKYNSQWAKKNPDLVLANMKRAMKRLGDHYNLIWHKIPRLLKGWARIIHQDCNETCQICDKPSTQAHHILYKANYPTLVFNRNNGIALCDQCHYEVHGKMLV